MSPYLTGTHTPPISPAVFDASRMVLHEARAAWLAEVREARREGRAANQEIGNAWVEAGVRWQALIGCQWMGGLARFERWL